jgi:hypothetical protein
MNALSRLWITDQVFNAYYEVKSKKTPDSKNNVRNPAAKIRTNEYFYVNAETHSKQ